MLAQHLVTSHLNTLSNENEVGRQTQIETKYVSSAETLSEKDEDTGYIKSLFKMLAFFP